MNPDEFEQRMRALECFHTLAVLPGTWPVIRVDGRSFSRLTETRFEKPFDLLDDPLVQTAATDRLDDGQGLTSPKKPLVRWSDQM